MKSLYTKKEQSLYPDKEFRPVLFPEGFYQYHNPEANEQISHLALDILVDYKGDIIFTSLRDYQMYKKLKGKNPVFYLTDIIYQNVNKR